MSRITSLPLGSLAFHAFLFLSIPVNWMYRYIRNTSHGIIYACFWLQQDYGFEGLLDAFWTCERTWFGPSSSSAEAWTRISYCSGPRAFGCNIQGRVISAPSFLQPGKTNKHPRYENWSHSRLSAHSLGRRNLVRNEMSTGEEPPWIATSTALCKDLVRITAWDGASGEFEPQCCSESKTATDSFVIF